MTHTPDAAGSIIETRGMLWQLRHRAHARFWTGLLLMALLGGCQRTFFAVLNRTTPDGQSETHGIVFETTHGLKLDVYRPLAAHNAPVVVFFHGGSWARGKREWYAFVGRALAAHGYVAVLPQYRLYPAAQFPEFMLDGAQAVAYARAHAAQWGGDGEQLFLMGHSAGAHIAALLGTDARYLGEFDLSPRQLRGVIGLAGPYDFLPIVDLALKRVFGPPELHPQSQPVNFVDGDEPPFLLLHGERDTLVWPRNSESMATRLRAQHRDVTLKLYPKMGHVRLLGSLAERQGEYGPSWADITAFIVAQDASSQETRR
jgi:acetyl esterase/lipase